MARLERNVIGRRIVARAPGKLHCARQIVLNVLVEDKPGAQAHLVQLVGAKSMLDPVEDGRDARQVFLVAARIKKLAAHAEADEIGRVLVGGQSLDAHARSRSHAEGVANRAALALQGGR